MSLHEFEQALAPLTEFIATLDPSDPESVRALNERFPCGCDTLERVASLFADGVAEGWLCHRDGGEHVSYSRVRKSQDGSLSIDAVRMTGPGPGHLHPHGEFDLCFAVAGEPLFDDAPATWHVYPPGSWHVPTVTGGIMNILYFLPQGAIEFGPRPNDDEG